MPNFCFQIFSSLVLHKHKWKPQKRKIIYKLLELISIQAKKKKKIIGNGKISIIFVIRNS